MMTIAPLALLNATPCRCVADARGFSSQWDVYFDQLGPTVRRMPYMTTGGAAAPLAYKAVSGPGSEAHAMQRVTGSTLFELPASKQQEACGSTFPAVCLAASGHAITTSPKLT